SWRPSPARGRRVRVLAPRLASREDSALDQVRDRSDRLRRKERTRHVARPVALLADHGEHASVDARSNALLGDLAAPDLELRRGHLAKALDEDEVDARVVALDQVKGLGTAREPALEREAGCARDARQLRAGLEVPVAILPGSVHLELVSVVLQG